MKKFPGKVKHGGRNHRQVILDDDQLDWLRVEYPKTESPRLAKAMGVSVETVRKLARLNGICKSDEGLKAIRKRCSRRAARTNERNGCYERKRGHAPSDATVEGQRKRWADIRAGLRESPQETAKRRNPEAWQASLKKRSENRKEMIRKEKMRVLYGLERKTSLKAVVMKPYTRSQIAHRYNALRRGYLLDEDCREGQTGRYVIWYDAGTVRNAVFEENCVKDGFEIKECV